MRADATSTSRRAPPGPRGHGWTPRALPSLETRARTLEQASNQGLAALNIWPTMRGCVQPTLHVEQTRSDAVCSAGGSLSLGPGHASRAVFIDVRRAGRRFAMLVLTRKSNQSIMIGDDIEISVLAIMGEKVRIGIQAPRDVPVFRKEVYLEIQQEQGASREKAARDEVDAALNSLSENGQA